MKIKIIIYELDSKKHERITNIKIFENRIDAQSFLDSIQAIPRPYKINNNCKYYEYLSL